MPDCTACGLPLDGDSRRTLAGPVHAPACPTWLADLEDALVAWHVTPGRGLQSYATTLFDVLDQVPAGYQHPTVDLVRAWRDTAHHATVTAREHPHIRKRGHTARATQVVNDATAALRRHAAELATQRDARGHSLAAREAS